MPRFVSKILNQHKLPMRTLTLSLASFCRLFLAVILIPYLTVQTQAADRPNILWLSCEDISPHLGCYGYPNATTPHLDDFATQGTLYTHAFVTAGVCAPCRSAVITGMYQTTLGTHHMRCKASLPDHIKPFPMFLREAGYYCTNNSKTDYQFTAPKDTWDASSGKAHWKHRKDNQPFFSVFNFTGCHESGIANENKWKTVTKGLQLHDRDTVASSLPPYYPNTPLTREDWGRYYDVITAMDRWFGEHLQALDDAGLADDTIVIFWSDHGVGLPRAKRWLYDSGMRVPLILRIPKKYRRGQQGLPGIKTDQLISLIDLGPTTLNIAGITPPAYMQGRPFLGANLPAPRQFVFGARDRMDERYDIIRAVRTKRFKYIRNYEPFKTFYQYMNTPEKGATMQEIRRVAAEGTLPPAAMLFMSPTKAKEELYDTQADPHELNNLCNHPDYTEELKNMREAHLAWVTRTRDIGLIPESEIAEGEEAFGSAWEILNGGNAGNLNERLRDAASLSLAGRDALPAMMKTLSDDHAAIRFWGAIGIGNIKKEGIEAIPQLHSLMQNDASDAVRTAAARALIRMGQPQEALDVLAQILNDGTQWARLRAAIVLDETDRTALPVLETMKQNKTYRQGMVADGKYTVRVLNRALNELLGTHEVVP